MTVVGGKFATLAACGGAAHVVYHGLRDVARCVALQAQAKAQVYVFVIAEVAFIKTPCRHQRLAPVKCSGGAGGENFSCQQVRWGLGLMVVLSPSQAARVVAVAGSIQRARGFMA